MGLIFQTKEIYLLFYKAYGSLLHWVRKGKVENSKQTEDEVSETELLDGGCIQGSVLGSYLIFSQRNLMQSENVPLKHAKDTLVQGFK